MDGGKQSLERQEKVEEHIIRSWTMQVKSSKKIQLSQNGQASLQRMDRGFLAIPNSHINMETNLIEDG